MSLTPQRLQKNREWYEQNKQWYADRKQKRNVFTVVQDHRWPGDIHYSLAIEVVSISKDQKEDVEAYGGIWFKRKMDAEAFAEISMGDGPVPKIHGRFPNKVFDGKRLYVPTNAEREMAGWPPLVRDVPTTMLDNPLSGRKGLKEGKRQSMFDTGSGLGLKEGQRKFVNDDGTYKVIDREIGLKNVARNEHAA